MTKTLFDEFPYTSAEEWLAQIRKDLKGKTPEEMLWSPDGSLITDPFVHAEHSEGALSPIPGFGQWKIGETFAVSDAHETHDMLHEALMGGAESLRLKCNGDIDWSVLLEDIALPMIHLGIEFSDGSATGTSALEKYLDTQFATDDINISIDGRAVNRPGIRRCIRSSRQELTIVEGLAQTIVATIQAADADPTLLRSSDLSINIGHQYLIEIARLRALRILWQNVSDALGFRISTDFAIEAHTAAQEGDSPYDHMISSTFMAMSAVFGAADRIYITPAHGTGHSESFYRHIARNIHHLLRYESKLNEIPDPVAGAYYFDKVTRDLVRQTWDLVVDRIQQC